MYCVVGFCDGVGRWVIGLYIVNVDCFFGVEVVIGVFEVYYFYLWVGGCVFDCVGYFC